jgi:ubiquinone/menaquinone biosynthesis C-methylase UbiE
MAFEELKQRQAKIWSAGPFENVANEIANLHEHLVRALDPQPDEKWLDVGTGTGAVALRAARAGADVTGSDLSPGLIETAKQLAAQENLDITFEVGDAEQLPYGNGDFDVVSSSVGASFAPDHRAVARELARVTKPGGRLGLIAWEPEGGIGEFFGMMRRFQPPPPEGAGAMLDWGREGYVRELLGSDFDLTFEHATDPQVGQSGEQIWQIYVTSFGPVKTLYESLDEERKEELHRSYVDFYEGHRHDGAIAAPREYLVTLGRRK